MILDGIWVLCMDGDVNLCLKMRVRLRSITVRYGSLYVQNHKAQGTRHKAQGTKQRRT